MGVWVGGGDDPNLAMTRVARARARGWVPHLADLLGLEVVRHAAAAELAISRQISAAELRRELLAVRVRARVSAGARTRVGVGVGAGVGVEVGFKVGFEVGFGVGLGLMLRLRLGLRLGLKLGLRLGLGLG